MKKRAFKVTNDIRQGVVFLWTGAWHDPDYDAMDARDHHGNPDVLTHDRRTSRLAQGSAAHSAFVECRAFADPVPKIKAFEAPTYVGTDS